MSEPAFKSVYDTLPTETGTPSRLGYLYQDHVTIGMALTMLQDPQLEAISCENHDDVALVWRRPAGAFVEFVQVKDENLDQLWSISLLCERKKGKRKTGKAGTSILEKSLAHDRVQETATFRLVTSRGVKKELEVLTIPTEKAAARDKNKGDLDALQATIERDHFKGITSGRGNGLRYWLDNTTWQVGESLQAVKTANFVRILQLASGAITATDVDFLHRGLLDAVQAAAHAKPKVEPEKKWIRRGDLRAWFDRTTSERIKTAASIMIGVPTAMALALSAQYYEDRVVAVSELQPGKYPGPAWAPVRSLLFTIANKENQDAKNCEAEAVAIVCGERRIPLNPPVILYWAEGDARSMDIRRGGKRQLRVADIQENGSPASRFLFVGKRDFSKLEVTDKFSVEVELTGSTFAPCTVNGSVDLADCVPVDGDWMKNIPHVFDGNERF